MQSNFIAFSWDYESLCYTSEMNQDQAYVLLTMWKNILLTGAAGSGKTYLVNKFIDYCRQHNICLAITGSTGIAATHIGWMTVHSWSGMWIRDTLSDQEIEELISREYLVKRFVKTSVIIIDEISMLSGNFIASLDRLLQSARISSEPFGGIQIVFVGDFFQLPPVSRWNNVSYAFEHRIWEYLNLTPCVLTTQYRQSAKETENSLLSILNEIRSWTVSDWSRELLLSRNTTVFTDDHTELFTHNKAVDEYNNNRLSNLFGEEYIFTMNAKWSQKFSDALKKWCLAPENLVIKKWARVMFVKNNPEAGYMNGTVGHIVWLDNGEPIVELLDGQKITVSETEWMIEDQGKIKASISQIPLRLAWAITVHKSQGMTLDTAVMNLMEAFIPWQWYVALSRVRTLEGLILRGFNSIALEIDSRVREYDMEMSIKSDELSKMVYALTDSEISEYQEFSIKKLGWVLHWQKTLQELALVAKKIPTHLETFAYINKGMSLEEIASLRDLKVMTIFSHLEKLIDEGKNIDLALYRPDDEWRLGIIHEAFINESTLQLWLARQYLQNAHGENYSFDEIRIARLFLSEEDKLTIEGTR